MFTPDSIRLHLADEQKDNRTIEGKKLRKILESTAELTLLPDAWLDFLLAHPQFIPES